METPQTTLRLFGLYEDRHAHKLVAVLKMPENVSHDAVTAAWAYAVMYSAKGLTIPDYDAAIQLLKKRHPSWEVVGYEFRAVELDLAKVDIDVPEA